MSFKVTVIIRKDDDWYVATCLENDVASQGKTIEEAIVNLREALELYFEDVHAEDASARQTYITTLEITV